MPDVRDDADAQRLELLVDGELAGWLDYRAAGEDVVLAHTEVLAGHEGQGLGGQLVRAALDWAEERQLLVMPTCPFALAWLRKHPEFQDRVDPSMRAQVRG